MQSNNENIADGFGNRIDEPHCSCPSGYYDDGSSNECKLLKTKENSKKIKNRHSIKLEAKKWVKISDYENESGKAKKFINKLNNDFNNKALEFCAETKNFVELEKRFEIIDIDDTPAIGTETVVKIGIIGVVACK